MNRIEVIELRTDPKYGKFFQHQPAKARVKASRKRERLVEVEDFISPSVVERLQEAGLLKPKIDDWRAMVDCVLIDADYDGKVFRIGLSDVPEKKTDLVAGRYELPAPGARRSRSKIIDMLGEEVLGRPSLEGVAPCRSTRRPLSSPAPPAGSGSPSPRRLAADGPGSPCSTSTAAGGGGGEGGRRGAVALVADVTRSAEVDAAVQPVVERWGRLDMLVNNAGITGRSFPIWELDDADWERVLAVDLTSVFYCCRAAIRVMLRQGIGRIVNIASIAGKEGNPTLVPYSSAKAGVIG